ncbi:hypothetical protein V1478_011176, partial [Vespula squamosa]
MKTVAGLGEGWKGCRYGPALAEGAVPKGADAIPRCWRFLEITKCDPKTMPAFLLDSDTETYSRIAPCQLRFQSPFPSFLSATRKFIEEYQRP